MQNCFVSPEKSRNYSLHEPNICNNLNKFAVVATVSTLKRSLLGANRINTRLALSDHFAIAGFCVTSLRNVRRTKWRCVVVKEFRSAYCKQQKKNLEQKGSDRGDRDEARSQCRTAG